MSEKELVERLRPSWAFDEGISRAFSNSTDTKLRKAVSDYVVASNEIRKQAADLIERLEARAEAAEAERDALRTAVIEAGRAAGASLADTVSNEFLLKVPAEVRLVVVRLTSERDALAKAAQFLLWQHDRGKPTDDCLEAWSELRAALSTLTKEPSNEQT